MDERHRQTIKIAFTDFPGPFNPNAIENFLARKYNVVVDEENPDYVIFSVFGHQYLKCANAIRIFFTGENVHPDFNLCDYAFGFDWLTLEDRYYRCPNFMLYDEFRELRDGLRTTGPIVKQRFCNFIYSNANCHPYRDSLFRALCGYRNVESAGAHLNNVRSAEGVPFLGPAMIDKLTFQREYKFSIAVENSSTIGYTTEKLIHALAADTVPIYWGDPEVGRQFNTKRFINCHDFDSVEAVVARVREVDQSDAALREILSEPVFPNGIVPEGLTDAWLMKSFDDIFGQEKSLAYRRNAHVWGRIYEEKRCDEIRANSRPEGLVSRIVSRARRSVKAIGIRLSSLTARR